MMAVQAQYPSNVFLLNRNVQEGKSPLGDAYELKPQQGGGLFLDHTNMPFNHGGIAVGDTKSRKRGRDSNMAATLDSPLISMQQQQKQNNFVDLGQLHTPQKLATNRNFVSTGLGLAFGDQQLTRQQQKQSLSPQSSFQSSVLLSLLSDELGSHIKQQSEEIDNFLLAQGEELRQTLAEKGQRHYRTLLTAAEESLSLRVREKEHEVEKAARRNAELEAKAKQLGIEAQAWQTSARMQENYAATLQLQLQQAMIAGSRGLGQGRGAQVVQDGGGGNNSTAVMGGEGEAEDAESAYIDPDRVVAASLPSCKACRKRVAAVVLLPCRHMCLCAECDAVAQACPTCLSVRSSSIEVSFS